MRRAIDVSMIVETEPSIDPVMPPAPPPPHKEPFGANRPRDDIMFWLRIQPSQFGETAADLFEQITVAVDPAGTHVETYYPEKFFYNGKNTWAVRDVAHLPIKTLVNEAAVVDVPDTELPLYPRDLIRGARHLKEGDGVLLRAGLNQRWLNPGLHPEVIGNVYAGQKTGMTPEAAQWLTSKGIRLCGFDFRSPEDPTNRHELPVHAEMHLNNVLLVEDVANLDQLRQERVLLLTGTPLKARHMDGGLARLVALETESGGGYRPVDLTHVLGPYPQPRAPHRRIELVEDRLQVMRRADFMFFEVGWGGWSDVVGPQYMRFSTQAGTHLVNPFKRVDGEYQPLYAEVMSIPLSRLVAPGALFDLSYIGPRQVISRDDIRQAQALLEPGGWAVLRTDHSDWYRSRPDFLEDSPVLSPEAVDELAGMGAKGIVTDLTQLAPLDRRWELQAALHEHDMLAVEAAWHLWLIRKPTFTVAVLPLNIKDLQTSPAHTFILEHWE